MRFVICGFDVMEENVEASVTPISKINSIGRIRVTLLAIHLQRLIPLELNIPIGKWI